jgi:hypothetical protein
MGSHLLDQFGEAGTGFRDQGRGRITKSGGLLLDGLDYMRVLVADIDIEKLGGPIQIAFIIGVPEIDTLRAGHREGLPGRLGGP